MIWLTWRQHRAVLAVTAGFVLALAAWMLLVEHNYSEVQRAIVRSCTTTALYSQNSACSVLVRRESSAWGQADIIRFVLLALPLLVGAIFGAPLFANELEHKTIILTLTQTVSRTRWTAIRWLLLGLVTVALTAVTALVSTWWLGHVPTNGSSFTARIQPEGFDVTGIVPVAYAVFAFALGAVLGIILRRTARAIFGTVVLFIASRALFEHYVRAHLVAPIFVPANAGATFPYSGRGWTFSTGYRVAPHSGHPNSQAYLNHVLAVCSHTGTNVLLCLSQHRVQLGTFLQPASRYWVLQWGEGAAYLAATLGLFGVAIWAIRRWKA